MFNLLNILDINSLFLIRLQNTNNIEVCCSILVVHLLSHCQYPLKFTLYSSFFHHFPFNSLLNSFSLVYVSSWKLPRFAFTLSDTPSLLDQQHLFLVVYHNTSNSYKMVSVGWESICNFGVSPQAHKDVISSLMRVMEIESVL